MTPEDDAYASDWFVPVEELAQTASVDVEEIRRLQLANRLPLPSYIRRDGTQMVARDLLELANEAGGFDELPAWFARQWDSPDDAVREWNDYLGGLYVCLRSWRPENMRRKDELVALISTELERHKRTTASGSSGSTSSSTSSTPSSRRLRPTIGCASAAPSRVTA